MFAVSYKNKAFPLATPSLHTFEDEQEALSLYWTAMSLPECEDVRFWEERKISA